VKIIDKAEGPTTRSYACGIHPGTLHALEALGVLAPISNAGNRIDKICLYDGGTRRAEVDLSKLHGDFPHALALPQSELEAVLETELRRHGVNIDWNHRLASLDLFAEKPKAVLEKFGLNSTGIIYAETTMLVQSEWDITANFIIGTDGADSFVR